MRIAINTLGTRGDVQPYLALALGLMDRGHDVQLAAPQQFEAMILANNVPFVALPGEFLALMDTPEGKSAIAGSKGFGAGFKLLKYVRPMIRKLMDIEWQAAKAFAPDVIVYHPKSIASPHIAEALGIPFLLASPLPGFTPTFAFPSPMLPYASLGPLNKLSHALAINGANVLFGRSIADWRANVLGLPPKPRRPLRPHGTLYAYSPHVLPVPGDWGANVAVTGYWFLDSPDWTMPPDLRAFLDAGPAPVYVGFGSMPGIEPAEMTLVVTQALARTGKRGVFASGGGAIGVVADAPHVHALSGAPHDRLLPLMHATIHHGGAGTTGASLRAGLPTALCPFFGDQPFWARRVVSLGVGPAPLDRKSLTVESVAQAITAMDEPGMRGRAVDLGAAIRRETGVASACDFIEAGQRHRAT